MSRGNRGWISQHSIAEVYSTLTSAPLTPRIQPLEALRILEENLLPHLNVVALSSADYRAIIREAGEKGWRSGMIYDGLLLRCAGKQPIDRLYTFNLRHFVGLAPESLRSKITAPV